LHILVTGGAGYIGSHLADRLLAEGHNVTVVDDLSVGQRCNFEHNLSNPHYRFVQGSILDRELMQQLVEECEVVYHLAAVVGVRYVVDDPLRSIQTNLIGTEIVLSLAYRYGRRVLFASTSEVYGKNPRVPFSEKDDRVLGPTWVARWSYSTAKALDEHLCFAYCAKGLPVTIVRYFNSYGPRLDPKGYGSVIAQFIMQALRGEPLTVHGSGQQTRAFTYIDDTVRGTIAAATSSAGAGQVFNIGNAQGEISILNLAHLIRELTESTSEIVFVPYARIFGANFEDAPKRLPDTTKAERYLDFRAEVPLREGLKRTIAWFEREMDTQER